MLQRRKRPLEAGARRARVSNANEVKEGCGRPRYRGLLAPLILILLGSVFLLQNAGLLPHAFARQWWPLLLVVIGVAMLLRRNVLRR